MVQLSTPNEMRGRVVSIYMMAFRGGMPLGSLAAAFRTIPTNIKPLEELGLSPGLGVNGGIEGVEVVCQAIHKGRPDFLVMDSAPEKFLL